MKLSQRNVWSGSVAAVIATGLIVGAIRPHKSAQAAPAIIPEVQVESVEQQDVPIVGEWIGTLDGLVNADVMAQVPYYLNDRKLRISVARINDRLYAFDDLCTCAKESCPLSGGMPSGTTIMCQCHASRFDIATGAVLKGPAIKALNVYKVQDLEGSIRIRV